MSARFSWGIGSEWECLSRNFETGAIDNRKKPSGLQWAPSELVLLWSRGELKLTIFLCLCDILAAMVCLKPCLYFESHRILADLKLTTLKKTLNSNSPACTLHLSRAEITGVLHHPPLALLFTIIPFHPDPFSLQAFIWRAEDQHCGKHFTH